jgi:uncharacterized protein
VSDQILERIQADTRTAMKAGERSRTAALRMIASAVQTAAKDGGSDSVAVLQRERKKRLEAAAAYREAGRAEQASAEEQEAELIAGYLPAELADEELRTLVDAAIAETGAAEIGETGKVMGAVMPKVKGRADGNRVSAVVRERLGS